MRTMRSSVMYRSKLRMGDMNLIKFLIITCDMLLRVHLRSSRSTALLGSGSGRVDGCGVAFYSCGSLGAPIPGLIPPLII